MPKILFIFSFVFILCGGATYVNDCDSMKLKTVITTKENVVSVEVKVENGVEPFRYFFHTAKGDIVSYDLKSNKVTGLLMGDYLCTVYDSIGCKRTVKFKVN